MAEMTREEADEALAKFGPDDVAQALHFALEAPPAPVWLAALRRHPAGGSTKGGRDSHRRGRRS
jgi:hypothetical protein